MRSASLNSVSVLQAVLAIVVAVSLSACGGRDVAFGFGVEQEYRAPRTAHGAPNVSGIWQANKAANWKLEAHVAQAGPMYQQGAAIRIQPGLGVGEGVVSASLPSALAYDNE